MIIIFIWHQKSEFQNVYSQGAEVEKWTIFFQHFVLKNHDWFPIDESYYLFSFFLYFFFFFYLLFCEKVSNPKRITRNRILVVGFVRNRNELSVREISLKKYFQPSGGIYPILQKRWSREEKVEKKYKVIYTGYNFCLFIELLSKIIFYDTAAVK